MLHDHRSIPSVPSVPSVPFHSILEQITSTVHTQSVRYKVLQSIFITHYVLIVTDPLTLPLYQIRQFTTMSYGRSWKEGDGDFLLVISGTISHAPYLTGWQEFKDNLRKVVKEQPGWANVYSSQGQRRGEMQGWCRLKDREDADAMYSIYPWTISTTKPG